MPKTFGGLIGAAFGAVIMVAIGVGILSRIPAVWTFVNKQS